MKKYKITVIILLSMLIALGVLFYALPNKPTVSEEENRTLAACPQFSFETIIDGSFMSDYTTYFSDNFPFREQLIKIANIIKGYKGTGGEDDVQIVYTDNGAGAMEEVEDDVWLDDSQLDLGISEETENTNQEEQAEEEAPPQVAFDDGISKNGIIVCGDTALPMVAQSKKNIGFYTTVINDFSNKYPDINVYCGVIPLASAYYLPEKFRTERNDQRQMIKNVYDLLDEDVITLDIYSNLEKHADEYIYLRTDHHWAGLGAYYAYEVFAQSLGEQPTPLSIYPKITYEGYLGTLYNKIGGNASMRDNPDTLIAYEIPFQYEARYWTNSNGSSFFTRPLVTDKMKSKNKYMAFTYGDHCVINITTPINNGRKLIVFKDSYANAFVPFLVQHFSEIYVIDPRYAVPSISKVIEEEGITDVLYFTNITNTSVSKRIVELRRVSAS